MSNRVVRIENYLPMLADLARRYWFTLPEYAKSWISADDLFHEVVIKIRGIQSKLDTKKARPSTFFFTAASRFLANKSREQRRIKRFGASVCLDDAPTLSLAPSHPMQETLGCFTRALSRCSEDTRRVILALFFAEASRRSNLLPEFAAAAKEVGLSFEDCLKIMRDPATRTYVARRVCKRVPHRRENKYATGKETGVVG